MKKVLVVEDNPDNLRLISYVLRRDGYEFLSAESGEQGVEVAIAEKPSFIIMDIDLPGIDGLEATRRIRKALGASIPIIAVTSLTMAGDKEKILEAGCNSHIEKPYDPVTIMGNIERVVRRSQ